MTGEFDNCKCIECNGSIDEDGYCLHCSADFWAELCIQAAEQYYGELTVPH